MRANQSIVATTTKDGHVSKRWSRFIVSRSYLAVLLNLLASISVWYFSFQNKITMKPLTYWWRFILAPSIVILGVTAIAHLLVRSDRLSKRMEEYVSMLLLLFICFFLSIFYSIATVLLITFAIPILLSTVYTSVTVTRNTFLMALVLMVVSAYKMSLSTQRNLGDWLIVEALAAAAIIISTYLLSKVLILYGEDNISVHSAKIELELALQLDPLTDLYNRRAYIEFIPQAIDRSKLSEQALSLAELDIDDFKLINDTYGHTAGDRVLLRLADLIRETVPNNAFAFRIGGEEFVILFEGYNVGEAAGVCEKLLARTREERMQELGHHQLTVSCGLAALSPAIMDPYSLFQAADEALYTAKARGKNQIVIHSDGQMTRSS